MVERLIIKDIRLDKVYKTTKLIKGRILKVVIISNKPMHHTRVIITTSDLEEVINHKIDNQRIILYPYNNIELVTNETPRTDYFYSADVLQVKVEDLEKDGVINYILIYYE